MHFAYCALHCYGPKIFRSESPCPGGLWDSSQGNRVTTRIVRPAKAGMRMLGNRYLFYYILSACAVLGMAIWLAFG
jgi:hypothetical protein